MGFLAFIKDLILLHDCVIIPGFGGFVTNYKSAKVHNSDFYPPAKVVSFNNKLKFNDGLFVNYIADRKGMNYMTAHKKVELLVQEMSYRLADGECISIEGIGNLFYNESNQLIFDPIQVNNLNLDAYGLSTFRYESLYAKKLSRPVRKEDREAVEVIFQNRSLKKMMIGVPLMIALSFFPVKDNKESILRSDLSVLSEMMSLPEPAQKVEEEVIPLVETVAVEDRYFIIAGSFRSRVNAERFLKQKQEEGFEARSLGLIKGLHYIALDGFPEFTDAKAKQHEIKVKYPESGVWIYAKSN